MKLRVALGIGALALLVAGLAAWAGFDQPTFSGSITSIGGDNGAAFGLCVPRRGLLEVQLLPFTRVLDARGRLFSTAARIDALQPGQRVQIWTTQEQGATASAQVTAVKIRIVAGPAGDSAASC